MTVSSTGSLQQLRKEHKDKKLKSNAEKLKDKRLEILHLKVRKSEAEIRVLQQEVRAINDFISCPAKLCAGMLYTITALGLAVFVSNYARSE